MSESIKCVKCSSERLIYIRKDSDWGGGGDQSRVNPDGYYNDGDPNTGPLELDIEFMLCLECGLME